MLVYFPYFVPHYVEYITNYCLCAFYVSCAFDQIGRIFTENAQDRL